MIVFGHLLVDPEAPPMWGWLRVENGVIREVSEGEPPASERSSVVGGPDHVITPAFFDAHCHLPQTDSVGIDGLPLLEWLDRAVFPSESWWGRGAALHMAMTAAARHLREGTVGVAAYLTSHGAVNREVLAMLASRTPLWFIAGRVGMDRLAPDDLLEEDRDRARQRPVRPCVLPSLGDDRRRVVSANPRFAVSCSEELLAEFGWWVRDHASPADGGGTGGTGGGGGTRGDGGAWVQTHLSESPDELAKIKELFPHDRDYTSVYDRFGLLTERTLLAHAVHLSDDERALIAERRSIVVHCPTANLFLQAGLFNLDKARAFGLRVALGSDIAGGPDTAMPRVARAMIETAKIRKMVRRAGEPPVEVPTPAEAWRMITSGNAELLGWPDAGRIEVGAAGMLLSLRVPPTWIDEHLVGRLIYAWDARLIEARVGFQMTPGLSPG